MTNAVDGMDWMDAAFEILRRNYRRKVAGLHHMLDDGDLDIFDALALAPRILKEDDELQARDEHDRRRLAWLEKYEIDWARIKKEAEE